VLQHHDKQARGVDKRLATIYPLFSYPSPPYPLSFLLRLIVTNSLAVELVVKITLCLAGRLGCFCSRTYTHAIDLEEH
jgi:hypothetical protein